MIYLLPGASRNFTIDAAPTGLAGQIAWRVENEADEVVIAPSSTGTTEFAAGAYRKSLGPFPTRAGTYVVIAHFPAILDEDDEEIAPAVEVTIDVTVARARTQIEVSNG